MAINWLLPLLALVGASGSQVRLASPDGTTRLLPEGRGLECFVFVLRDCPNANQAAPEMERIAKAYAAKGVRFWIVFEDPDVGEASAARHMREFGLSWGAVLDPEHRLARKVGARASPEASVFRRGGLAYRGRIDDRFVSPGQLRAQITHRDLREALDAVLAGHKPARARTQAIGCVLPRS
ncbi:MAG: hypothetical protein HYR64_08890 [Fimbriimonas ginsengisoli]|uniref:Thioredoxin domain-containing protein n=1 Tax=Fimbriimonas ginsengisoli TaxID=1005039 RepID=A0A931LWP7_FIMGI|nr:hypothetical protein [Fimbriimonas ginsengisoli]